MLDSHSPIFDVGQLSDWQIQHDTSKAVADTTVLASVEENIWKQWPSVFWRRFSVFCDPI